MKEAHTLKDLFIGRPTSLRLYRLVEKYIKSLGLVKISVTKTQVSFAGKTQFAWIWLPQFWIKKRPQKSITLTFAWPERILDSRIVQSVEPRPGRWTHHVIIEKAQDFDSTVRSWLRGAYDIGKVDRKKKSKPSD